MNFLNMFLVAFWASESVDYLAGNAGLTEPSDFILIILRGRTFPLSEFVFLC